MECPTCGTELTPKNRALLISVGSVLVASTAAVFFSRLVIPAAIAAFIIGLYLILWATRGKSLWCRTCKKAPYLF